MKKFYVWIWLSAAVMMVQAAGAAPANRVRGAVEDEKGEALPYCNVMFASARDTLQVIGDISDAGGRFDIAVPSGEYIMTVSMLGYSSHRRPVRVEGTLDAGVIRLRQTAVEIGAATVRADMIRRRADGYLFTPGNSSIVTGRTSLELLKLAPGVWIDDRNGITINGKTGTKVMVNDRLLKFSGDELSNYLENLNAEDIKSVEVVPDPGAKYDADASGGILKITLKRSSVAGLQGSVGFRTTLVENNNPRDLRPNVNLDFRKNRLSLYTSFSYRESNYTETDWEDTRYHNEEQRVINNDMVLKSGDRDYFGRLGLMYELTDRQSIGVDADYSHSRSKGNGIMQGDIRTTLGHSTAFSDYRSRDTTDRWNVSMNYRVKFDSLGSSLILMADYMRYDAPSTQLNYSSETPDEGQTSATNRYTGRRRGTDNYSVRADYTKFFKNGMQLEAGMKYAYTDMETDLHYADETGGAWVPDEASNDHYLYREGVLAGYANWRATLGPLSLTAGLRVENTDLRPYSYVNPDESRNQNYTDFFPTATLAVFFNREKGHLLSAGYNRRIRRPGFNNLNPFRIQLNNYTYIVGNPDLKPSYSDNYTLTGVIANVYSITAGYQIQKGAVSQLVKTDPNDPNILIYQHSNIDKITSAYIAFSGAVNPFKWWRMGLDANWSYNKNKLSNQNLNGGTFQGRVNNLFTMPKKWSAEVNYYYRSSVYQGTMKVGSYDQLNLNLKKTFGKNKFTASLWVNDVLDDGGTVFHATIHEPGQFDKTLRARNTSGATRTFGLALRYNFKAGKDVKVNKVKAGNEEERSR